MSRTIYEYEDGTRMVLVKTERVAVGNQIWIRKCFQPEGRVDGMPVMDFVYFGEASLVPDRRTSIRAQVRLYDGG